MAMAIAHSLTPLNEMERGEMPSLHTITKSITDEVPPNSTWRSEDKTLTSTTDTAKRRLLDLFRNLIRFESGRKQGPETIVKSLEDYPRGYPLLTSFLDSDENFMIFRRFGFLHTRLLLHKQDELRVLEEELDEMDRKDFDGEDKEVLMCREDDTKARKTLLDKIEGILLKYDTILLHAQQVVLSNKPAERDHNSVKNFMWNKKPLMEGDASFINHKDDLLTLRPGRETAWLDTFVERILKLFPRAPVQYLFCSKEAARKTCDPDIRYFTKSRVERLVNVLILCMILTLLVLPVYALYHISSVFESIGPNTSNAVCVGVLLISTLLFSAVLSLFTKARRHEVLAASAAYCAILVVFIGNIGVQRISAPHSN